MPVMAKVPLVLRVCQMSPRSRFGRIMVSQETTADVPEEVDIVTLFRQPGNAFFEASYAIMAVPSSFWLFVHCVFRPCSRADGNCRHQQRHQHADNGDDHQQLDQRKSRPNQSNSTRSLLPFHFQTPSIVAIQARGVRLYEQRQPRQPCRVRTPCPLVLSQILAAKSSVSLEIFPGLEFLGLFYDNRRQGRRSRLRMTR